MGCIVFLYRHTQLLLLFEASMRSVEYRNKVNLIKDNILLFSVTCTVRLQAYLSISKIVLHLNMVVWTILLTYLPTDIVIVSEFIKVFIFWIE
jgi:hypothetical protein